MASSWRSICCNTKSKQVEVRRSSFRFTARAIWFTLLPIAASWRNSSGSLLLAGFCLGGRLVGVGFAYGLTASDWMRTRTKSESETFSACAPLFNMATKGVGIRIPTTVVFSSVLGSRFCFGICSASAFRGLKGQSPSPAPLMV